MKSCLWGRFNKDCSQSRKGSKGKSCPAKNPTENSTNNQEASRENHSHNFSTIVIHTHHASRHHLQQIHFVCHFLSSSDGTFLSARIRAPGHPCAHSSSIGRLFHPFNRSIGNRILFGLRHRLPLDPHPHPASRAYPGVLRIRRTGRHGVSSP